MNKSSTNIKLQILFNYNDVVNPSFIIYFNCDKFLIFPSLVVNMAGFNLSCLNRPLRIFLSSVMSKKLCGSIILYITTGPTYLIITFLEAVHNWLVNGDIIYTKSALLY